MYIGGIADKNRPFSSFASSANNCQPRQNPTELPPAWQVPREATATNATWGASVTLQLRLVSAHVYVAETNGITIYYIM